MHLNGCFRNLIELINLINIDKIIEIHESYTHSLPDQPPVQVVHCTGALTL